MSSPKYDPEQALVLCRQHSYRPGLVLLYEKKRLYREVLQVRSVQLLFKHCTGGKRWSGPVGGTQQGLGV